MESCCFSSPIPVRDEDDVTDKDVGIDDIRDQRHGVEVDGIRMKGNSWDLGTRC